MCCRKAAVSGQSTSKAGKSKRQSLEHISLELLQEQGYFDMPIQVPRSSEVEMRRK